MSVYYSLRMVKGLLWRDFKVLSKTFIDNIIDSSIIVMCTYLVYGHLLPLLGMDAALVGPIFFGIIILVAVNIIYDRALRDIVDLTFIHYIEYQVSLPVSFNWILIKFVASYVLDIFLAVSPIFVIGYIVFYQYLDFSQGNVLLSLVSVILTSLVITTGFLVVIFTVSFTWFRENTFARILSPATLFGCIYFPWHQANQQLGIIGKLLLLSPITYMVESLRASFLGTQAFMPLWISWSVMIGIISINSIILRYSAYKKMNALI